MCWGGGGIASNVVCVRESNGQVSVYCRMRILMIGEMYELIVKYLGDGFR